MTDNYREARRWWSTAITDVQGDAVLLRGYPIEQLIDKISYAGIVWLLLRGELPSVWQERLLNGALAAAVDHGPQAPAIAAARMAATCGIGVNSALATGVGLLGDTHGGAVQQSMMLLFELGASSDLHGQAQALVETYKRSRRYVPGFGHRWHSRDPRRDPLLGLVAAARDAGAIGGDYLAAGLELESTLAVSAKSPVPMNIDGATAVLFCELGFAPHAGRGLFCLSRAVGILAHVCEEFEGGMRIKGPMPPSISPDYTGLPLRNYPSQSRTSRVCGEGGD